MANNKNLNTGISLENFDVLYGANYFSGGPVVRFRINLNNYDEVFSDQIPNFYDALVKYIPSLIEHHCSVGERGGFLLRLREGTLLGHIMEHIAIEFLNLAGMDVGFGKTRMTKIQGIYNVVIRFFNEKATITAGKLALNLINAILVGSPFDVQSVIDKLIKIREKQFLGPSTQTIVDEAKRRKIPVMRLDNYNMVQLGTGKNQRSIRATITDRTSLIAVETTDNKILVNSILKKSGIPTLQRTSCETWDELIRFYEKLQQPLVLKPASGFRGKHIYTELDNEKKIKIAFDAIKEYDNFVIVEECIQTNTYRMLLIDNKLVAAAETTPPFIIGNGMLTIQEAIERTNQEEERKEGILSKIELDKYTLNLLKINDLGLNSVLPENKLLYLKKSANMHLGASSIDVTDEVHPFNRFLAERISKLFKLDVCGIDVLTTDIANPINLNGGRIVDVHAAPDFRPHISPTLGAKRHVERQFMSMMFPHKAEIKIPIIAITGTIGKNFAAKLIHRVLSTRFQTIGWASKQGLFIGKYKLKRGESRQLSDNQIILKDPATDFALFEIPVESILQSGLSYEDADFGIVLNLAEKEEYQQYDHIRDLEDVAYAKFVVAEQLEKQAYAILNADDDLIIPLHERVYSRLALFSRKSENIAEHIQQENIAILLTDNSLQLFNTGKLLVEIPKTDIKHFQKELENHQIDSLLAAFLQLHLLNFSTEEITAAWNKML